MIDMLTDSPLVLVWHNGAFQAYPEMFETYMDHHSPKPETPVHMPMVFIKGSTIIQTVMNEIDWEELRHEDAHAWTFSNDKFIFILHEYLYIQPHDCYGWLKGKT